MANFVLTKNVNYPSGVNAYDATTSPPTGPILAAGDSGNIVTIGPPGVAAVKLTDMTQQSATTQAADSTVKGGGGNNITAAQVSTYGPAGPSKGYSILGE